MAQVRKQEFTLKQVSEVAANFHDMAARLDAIAVAAKSERVKTLDLKLGTLTGSLYQRMLDSLDGVEADARISIRKQTKRA